MTKQEQYAAMARIVFRIGKAVQGLSQLPEALLVEGGGDDTLIPADLEEGEEVALEAENLLRDLKKKLPPRVPRQRPFHRRRKTASSRPS